MSTTLLDSTTTSADEIVREDSSSPSSTESTASPLSKATYDIITLDPPTIQLIETNQELHKYKTKLKSLNSLLSPIQLFNKLDLIIRNHHKLKKEYLNQWKCQQAFRNHLRSIINQNTNSKQPIKLSKTLNNEMELFIQTIQNIQFPILQLSQICQQFQLSNTTNIKQISSTHKYKYRNKTIEMETDDSDTDENDKYPMTTSISQLKSTKTIKSYRRRSSVRSFGTLYSDQFRHSVAKHYKQSLTMNDEIKSEDIQSNNSQIMQYYHDNYIGQNELFESPFGIRPIIYCDWTASGKPLKCIEEYINNEMLPLYANTHTTTSITGIQTSKFRSEARSIILSSIGGNHINDVVIFTGSGATSAIYKLSRVLLKHNKLYKPFRTVVFISIYEHNSNIYIWKELGCKIIIIPENKNKKINGLDLNVLEKHLKFYTSKRMRSKYNLLIGSFSAASNVSGIIAPIDKTTELLHKYNALSFWDYATGGPYMDINMNNKDAVFISPHKYIGGPGTCGILCAKKHLFSNVIPVIPGGGTVFVAYGIKEKEYEYLENIEEREEGGTPNIIGSIRTSFVFMIKDHLNTKFIQEIEHKYFKYFMNECKEIKNLIIMGNMNKNIKRLPIFSFLITYTNGINNKTKYLHYNFIAALMNDLFGIQGRGGCACAGMYGKYVLNINTKKITNVIKQLRDNKNELARPGYFRINLHFTLNENELKYIVNAIKFVCKNGWLFLPLYDVDVKSGDYYYRNNNILQTKLKSLLDIQFNKNGISYDNNNNNNKRNLNLDKYLEIAENDILKNLKQYLPIKNDELFKNEQNICDENAWYWLPSELHENVINFIK